MDVFNNVLGWITSPSKDNSTLQFWLVGLIAILAVSFLWTQVVSAIEEV